MPPGRAGAGNPFQPNSRGGVSVGGKGKGKGVAMTTGGKSSVSKLAHAIKTNGGHGRLVEIKQEDDSGEDDDELESEDDVGEYGNGGMMQPPPAPNLSLRETIRKLAELLKESAEAAPLPGTNGTGDSDGLG